MNTAYTTAKALDDMGVGTAKLHDVLQGFVGPINRVPGLVGYEENFFFVPTCSCGNKLIPTAVDYNSGVIFCDKCKAAVVIKSINIPN